MMSRPEYTCKGDTLFFKYSIARGMWEEVSTPEYHLANGQHVIEVYVTEMFAPKPPPPRKIPNYRASKIKTKPKKTKSNTVRQLPMANVLD